MPKRNCRRLALKRLLGALYGLFSRTLKESTMDPGTICAIAGSAIGVFGGIFGTYFSIKNTIGPKERSFVMKASALTWVTVVIFLCALLLLPSPYNNLMWLPYGLLIGFGIRKFNETQRRIREAETTVES
jgi:hypothetical protein